MVSLSFKNCIKKKIIKNVTPDTNLINSIQEIASQKIKSSKFIPEEFVNVKITLLYDALREYLEARALEKGFKIYNHECYKSFIKEILGKSSLGDSFDDLRRLRNSINYYGIQLDKEEAKEAADKILRLIKEFKK